MELTLREEKVERRMTMVGVHSKFVGWSLPNEEEAAIFLCISSTSPAAHTFLAPAHQRSAVSRILDDSDRKFDSEQQARTRDDEECLERVMWSVKEISSDFLTACYGEQDNCCHLSENWFQQDARHYDEQQNRKRAEQQQFLEQQQKKRTPKEQKQLSELKQKKKRPPKEQKQLARL